MEINCIVIDDEPLALDLIESYIKKISYLRLKGLFHRPTDAIDLIRSGSVDLIYLDINMPEVTGIDFLKGLNNPPRVILITAYDQFAIDGFEVNAVDYLLKPVPFTRFLKATERASEIISKKISSTDDYILVKAEHNILKVPIASIYYIEGYKDYLKIYTDESKPILTNTSFKKIEQLLPSGFLRIHKSYLISVSKISSFRNSKVLVKDKHIPIGDSYKEIFYQKFVNGKIG